MSDLPKERCCEAVLFTQCGVVMFGPVTIREREREGLILSNIVPYSHVPLVQHFILR